MVRVKICGNRTIEEAKMAVEAGADAVGFLVGIRHDSDDSLAPETARDIVKHIPPFISTVVVTHLVTAKEVVDLCDRILPTTVQLHDDIVPRQIAEIRMVRPHLKLIKAIHVVGDQAMNEAKTFSPYVDAILLDSRTNDRIGGTGRIHDWDISERIVAADLKPVILAGGLTPNNISEAIAKVKPYGVDVHSGVEDEDGNRDVQKLKEFIRNAKECGS